jgi:hypothetical protein
MQRVRMGGSLVQKDKKVHRALITSYCGGQSDWSKDAME